MKNRISLSFLTLVSMLLIFSCGNPEQYKEQEQEAILRISDDLYIAGGQLSVEEKTGGDLIAAGGLIVISDSVKNDIWVVAGEVNINAPAGDDIRVFGGKADINESVQGDVLVFGMFMMHMSLQNTSGEFGLTAHTR